MNKEYLDIYNKIENLRSECEHLQLLKIQGIVNSVDAVIYEMKEKEFKEKAAFVLSVHEHKITNTFVNKNGKRVEVWQTVCGDKRPRYNTYKGLIECLYDYYMGINKLPTVIRRDYTFKALFEKAIEEKIRTEAPKEKTIRDIRYSYKAFITDEFGSKDIRDLPPSEVKAYIQETTQRLKPTKKRLYKFKGVLNLVFNYALAPERRYIEVNPIPQNNRPYEKNCEIKILHPEDKAFQPSEIKMIRDYLWKRVKAYHYDVNGYAILFSSETGVREGEIPALKWCDVHDNKIHIHSQQNDEQRDGRTVYYYNPTTKDEKGVSKDGRYIPITKNVRKILDELKAKQIELGIHSEWVFCKLDGSWMTTMGYYKALYNVCKNLNLRLNNNHAFRIALNSYVFIPMGLPVTERARLLGHSPDTNLKHYSFARDDEYLSEICEKWDAFVSEDDETSTFEYPNIIEFEDKRKAQFLPENQAFLQL